MAFMTLEEQEGALLRVLTLMSASGLLKNMNGPIGLFAHAIHNVQTARMGHGRYFWKNRHPCRDT